MGNICFLFAFSLFVLLSPRPLRSTSTNLAVLFLLFLFPPPLQVNIRRRCTTATLGHSDRRAWSRCCYSCAERRCSSRRSPIVGLSPMPWEGPRPIDRVPPTSQRPTARTSNEATNHGTSHWKRNRMGSRMRIRIGSRCPWESRRVRLGVHSYSVGREPKSLTSCQLESHTRLIVSVSEPTPPPRPVARTQTQPFPSLAPLPPPTQQLHAPGRCRSSYH